METKEVNLFKTIEELGFTIRSHDALREITIPQVDTEKIKRYFELLKKELKSEGLAPDDFEKILKRIHPNSRIMDGTRLYLTYLRIPLYDGKIYVGYTEFHWDNQCEISCSHRYRRGLKDSLTSFFIADWEKILKETEDMIKKYKKRRGLLVNTNLGFKLLLNETERTDCYLSLEIHNVVDRLIRTENLEEALEGEIRELIGKRDFINQIINFYEELKELKNEW